MLVMHGDTGSGKTFCRRWITAALDLEVQRLSPLDIPPQPPATKAGGKKAKAKLPPKPAKKKDVEEEEEKEEAKLPKPKTFAEERLRDLCTRVVGAKPRLVVVQDLPLFPEEFVRYLLQLAKTMSRMSRTAAIVLELDCLEAYGTSGHYDSTTGRRSSLAGHLRDHCATFCKLVQFHRAKPFQTEAFVRFQRHRQRILPRATATEDGAEVRRIAAESHGDFRQVRILADWPQLAGTHTIRSNLHAGLVWMQSIRSPYPLSWETTEAIVDQLETSISSPALSIANFTGRWSESTLESEPEPESEPSESQLVSCRMERFAELLLRAVQFGIRQAEYEASRIFVPDAPRKTAVGREFYALPGKLLMDVFGRINRVAPESACFIDFILSHSFCGGR